MARKKLIAEKWKKRIGKKAREKDLFYITRQRNFWLTDKKIYYIRLKNKYGNPL